VLASSRLAVITLALLSTQSCSIHSRGTAAHPVTSCDSGATTASTTGHRLLSDSLLEAVDRLNRARLDSGTYSGSVLIAEGECVRWFRAYGLARRDPDLPISRGTRFNIASVTKLFTAVAIQQLIEEGRLSLDDSVSALLPGMLPDSIARRIRVRHLLTHTEGLGETVLGQMYFQDWHEVLPNLRLFHRSLAHPPGTHYEYVNEGYDLLGAILEARTHQSAFDVLRDRVFRRAGMTATGPYPETSGLRPGDPHTMFPGPYALGYAKADSSSGRFETNWGTIPISSRPTGSFYSTADDLARFAFALRQGRLLSAEGWSEMSKARPELGANDDGYGIKIFSHDGPVMIGKFGGDDFYHVHVFLLIFPESNETAVLLSNMYPGSRPVVQMLLNGAGRASRSRGRAP
jgi:CubicO group peptidase (beta-lactamase class C family)